MDRPQLRPLDKLRVELRLPARVAEVLYLSAQEWQVSLSEADARLILSGSIRETDQPKGTGGQRLSCMNPKSEYLGPPRVPPTTNAEGGRATSSAQSKATSTEAPRTGKSRG